MCFQVQLKLHKVYAAAQLQHLPSVLPKYNSSSSSNNNSSNSNTTTTTTTIRLLSRAGLSQKTGETLPSTLWRMAKTPMGHLVDSSTSELEISNYSRASNNTGTSVEGLDLPTPQSVPADKSVKVDTEYQADMTSDGSNTTTSSTEVNEDDLPQWAHERNRKCECKCKCKGRRDKGGQQKHHHAS